MVQFSIDKYKMGFAKTTFKEVLSCSIQIIQKTYLD
jgi:hypothetical protein